MTSFSSDKTSVKMQEDVEAKAPSSHRVLVTAEDDARIRRLTDRWVLSVLMFTYFFQILDKSIIGYSAVFGFKQDANLVGNQYNTISSVGYYAQIGAQPLAAYLLVKVPIRIFMPVIVGAWAISLCGMAASTNYKSLVATRFLLGWFEAACLPLFTYITATWYRRSEQPFRIALWYGTNGLATIVGSALTYAIGHIRSSSLYTYQIVFLLWGLITVVWAAALPFLLSNSVANARFLSPEDRLKAVERLRSNRTGIASDKFRWSQVLELVLEPKTWIFLSLTFFVNSIASVSNAFGPIILQSVAGFDSYKTMLLNMPFGALQIITILAGSYCAWRFSIKSVILAAFMIPVIIGPALLYTLERTRKNLGPLLVGYYFIAFLFAANPLIVSWMTANTGGSTKKAAIFTSYNAASAAGNVLGPYLFPSADAKVGYKPGLRTTMAFAAAIAGLAGVQAAWLFFLNKRKERKRVAMGRPAKIADHSMDRKFRQQEIDDEEIVQDALHDDRTDKQNVDFVYVY